MPIELTMLASAVVLGLVQLLLAAYAKRGQDGFKWAAGPRDEPRTYSGIPARLDRAEKNFMETFAYFAVAVLAVCIANRSSALTAWGSELYLAARVIYVPLYAFGVPLIRSVAWGLSLGGILMVLSGLL